MAVSTITLQSSLDVIAGKGIPDPRNQAGGYGDALAIRLGNHVIADLITERFNWPFNRAVATPFYTNTFQQDYPQPAQPGGFMQWGEDCDYIDINNTTIPIPCNWDGAMIWRRQLSRTSATGWRPRQISWMYNNDLNWGTWPGASKVFSPLVTTGRTTANPIMNFIDKNGNYLILSTFGTTGSTAPFLPASSAEGVTVTDGSCVWMCVSGNSQGFRLDVLPSSTGQVLQIVPIYQRTPPVFTKLSQTLDPIPDDFSRHFDAGLEWQCLGASTNPADRQRANAGYPLWLNAMEKMIKQGNKSPDVYRMIASASPVADRWDYCGPRTADSPF